MSYWLIRSSWRQEIRIEVQSKSYEKWLSRKDYMICALGFLEREGVVGVRVERLACDLGVTNVH